MKVYVVNSKKVEKYNFPHKVEDFFSIDFFVDGKKEKYNITFEGRENIWYLKTNGNVNVVSQNRIIDEIQVQDYGVYTVKLLGIDEIVLVYIMPTQEDTLYSLEHYQFL